MKNSQLIAVLRTLTKKEIRELRKWLQSPVHNQREDVIKLFHYLMNNGHLEDEKYLIKERIFKKVFPREKFDDAKIRQTNHFLLKAIEEYLIYIYIISEEEIKSKITLSKIYRKRNVEKAFQKTMRTVNQLQLKSKIQDENYLRNEYLYQQELYTFLENKKRTVQMNLQEISNSLDLSFFAEKLRQSCLMQSHQKVYEAGYTIDLLVEVIKQVEEKKLFNVPAIGIYYYIYKAQTEKETPITYFEKIKEQIATNGDKFSHSELRDIYLMGLNFCILRINAGDRMFARESFELYKNGFESRILIEDDKISKWTFRNLIRIGTNLKEFKWIEYFIKNYQIHLLPKDRENMVRYGMAMIYFTKGDYDKAMPLLIQFEDDDILTNLYGKSMLLQMYYEEQELESLESLLESMRNYIHRKKVIGNYYKTIYSNLAKYTRKLIRVNPYDDTQVNKLREEIKVTNPLPVKQWLLQQLDNL